MDAMALLCTLHADGPTTLQRLRTSGFETLAALEEAPIEHLAELLDAPPAAARRFVREAAALRARLDPEEAVRSEAPAIPPAEVRSAPPSLASLSGRDRELVGKVMDRWRERDAAETGEAIVELESGLRPGTLDGLTQRHCDELLEQGIDSLEKLSRIDPLTLCREPSLSFSTLRRFQFLALREVRSQAPTVRFSHAERPPVERAAGATTWNVELLPKAPPELPPDGAGPGGPFA